MHRLAFWIDCKPSNCCNPIKPHRRNIDMSFKFPSLTVILFAAVEIAPLSSARIFLSGRNYPSGGTPLAALVQDFNNDGIADIASANGTVSVFLGNSDGTFGSANTFPVGPFATEIASADLNGDGNADLVVTDDRHTANVVLGRWPSRGSTWCRRWELRSSRLL